MIERIYLDNIRTFVNFEWQPPPFALILGRNGSGKTALVSTLADIQRFVAGDASTEESFPVESRTRWQDKQFDQTVEIDLRTPGGLCRYRLVVEHDARNRGRNRVKEESVRLDGRPLIEFSLGKLQLYRDNDSKGPELNTKWNRSGVGAVSRSPDAELLSGFKDGMQHLWLLRPDPRHMEARLNLTGGFEGSTWLNADISNFADWYLKIIRENLSAVMKALRDLEVAVPGLAELHDVGGWLHARFDIDGKTQSFRFDELSDGQRALIALYMLRHVVALPGRMLTLDEPDNYVALPEIQPFLLQLERAALKPGGPQIWLISHHPELLNLFAVEHGWRFFREGIGHTRVERFQPATGVSPAETVARGWDDVEDR